MVTKKQKELGTLTMPMFPIPCCCCIIIMLPPPPPWIVPFCNDACNAKWIRLASSLAAKSTIPKEVDWENKKKNVSVKSYKGSININIPKKGCIKYININIRRKVQAFQRNIFLTSSLNFSGYISVPWSNTPVFVIKKRDIRSIRVHEETSICKIDWYK